MKTLLILLICALAAALLLFSWVVVGLAARADKQINKYYDESVDGDYT